MSIFESNSKVFVLYKGRIREVVFIRHLSPRREDQKGFRTNKPLSEINLRGELVKVATSTIHQDLDSAKKALAVFKTWMMEKDMEDIRQGYALMPPKDKALMKKKIELLTKLGEGP